MLSDHKNNIAVTAFLYLIYANDLIQNGDDILAV